MERNTVVLVDQEDKELGIMEKISAHEEGVLHRAFSVFIFNEKQELLLQQRSHTKYHGGGLWTNTCCSHPQMGEDVLAAAQERLGFEMGMYCDLEFSHTFIYNIKVENDLIEHELDHVYLGVTDHQPAINVDEVQDFKWISIQSVLQDIEENSSKYTFWFKEALPKVLTYFQNRHKYGFE